MRDDYRLDFDFSTFNFFKDVLHCHLFNELISKNDISTV